MIEPQTLSHKGQPTKPQPSDVLQVDRYSGRVRLLRDGTALRASPEEDGDCLMIWPTPKQPGRTTVLSVPEAHQILKLAVSLTGLGGGPVAEDGSHTSCTLVE